MVIDIRLSNDIIRLTTEIDSVVNLVDKALNYENITNDLDRDIKVVGISETPKIDLQEHPRMYRGTLRFKNKVEVSITHYELKVVCNELSSMIHQLY